MSTTNNLQIYAENIAHALSAKVNIYSSVNLHHITNVSWVCSCNAKFMYKLGEILVQGMWCKKCSPNGFGFIPTKILYVLSHYYITGKLPSLMEVNSKTHFIVNNKNLLYQSPDDETKNITNKDSIYFNYRLFNKGIHIAKLRIKEILETINVEVIDNSDLYDERSILSVEIYKLVFSNKPDAFYINKIPHSVSIKTRKITPDEIISTFKKELHNDVKEETKYTEDLTILQKKIKETINKKNDVFLVPTPVLTHTSTITLNKQKIMDKLFDENDNKRKANKSSVKEELEDDIFQSPLLNAIRTTSIQDISNDITNITNKVNDRIIQMTNEIESNLSSIPMMTFIVQKQSPVVNLSNEDTEEQTIKLSDLVIKNEQKEEMVETEQIVETPNNTPIFSSSDNLDDINDLVVLEDNYIHSEDNMDNGMFGSLLNVLNNINNDNDENEEQEDDELERNEEENDGETFNKLNPENMFLSVLNMFENVQDDLSSENSEHDSDNQDDESIDNEHITDKTVEKILLSKPEDECIVVSSSICEVTLVNNNEVESNELTDQDIKELEEENTLSNENVEVHEVQQVHEVHQVQELQEVQETSTVEQEVKPNKQKNIFTNENFDDLINNSKNSCIHGINLQFKCTSCDKTKQYKKKLIANCPYVNDYDLDKIVYKSAKEKVTITCKKHGEFSGNHKSIEEGKIRCPKC